MNEIQSIIFDMDGVIVDSESLHNQTEQATCKQYGIEAPWAEWDMFTGITEYNVFDYIIGHFTDGTYSIDELVNTKHEMFLHALSEKLQPIPGALDFIQYAKKYYQKLAVTTSSRKAIQERIFEIFDLHVYFDVVITGDEIRNSKPHPEPYLKTIDALNLASHMCVVVEDAVNGIIAAKKAGCRVVGITTSFAEEKLWNAGADIVVDSFSELYDRLHEMDSTSQVVST